ncbi:Adenylate kinase isoenzyme 1 [Camelus dromedarius]|uniref:Adenylate kinase isoenzyme 1 n=1 Tax=Camelus dromedarius TaxID=9838 RepID=A0A5N4CJT7_CAMDR|nr:Adenylate kinase isoenzyme 1 [Camelus dromedarius]
MGDGRWSGSGPILVLFAFCGVRVPPSRGSRPRGVGSPGTIEDRKTGMLPILGKAIWERRWVPTPHPPSFPGTADILKSPLIIFVMGGPGCGKGTQCKNMATKYGFCHVGLGQLLRQETQRGTRRGQKICDLMLQGLLVPTGVILDMISDHMLSCPESRGFLIDSFRRELRQAKEFERIVSDPCQAPGPALGLKEAPSHQCQLDALLPAAAKHWDRGSKRPALGPHVIRQRIQLGLFSV